MNPNLEARRKADYNAGRSAFLRTRLTMRRLAIGALLVTAKTVVLGASLTLDFGSLPSAQGWTYRTDGPSESDAYSVDGTKLILHTLGTGAFNTGYQIAGIVDPSRPFTISMRARVLQTEVLNTDFPVSTLAVLASTGTEVFGIGLNTTLIHAPLFSDQIYPIDATQFHDYRIEAMPGADARIFVDDVLFATGAPLSFPNPNVLTLANSSSEKGYAEITAFSFLQPIPEPETWRLMVLGAALLAISHRMKGRGTTPKPVAHDTLLAV
jgi:hypothetical protein